MAIAMLCGSTSQMMSHQETLQCQKRLVKCVMDKGGGDQQLATCVLEYQLN
jgi:hypothetical protein